MKTHLDYISNKANKNTCSNVKMAMN